MQAGPVRWGHCYNLHQSNAIVPPPPHATSVIDCQGWEFANLLAKVLSHTCQHFTAVSITLYLANLGTGCGHEYTQGHSQLSRGDRVRRVPFGSKTGLGTLIVPS
jgi:hypothetical protein